MSSVRTEEVEEDTAERRFAPISVHDRRNRCSPSSGTSVHHHRNTHFATTRPVGYVERFINSSLASTPRF